MKTLLLSLLFISSAFAGDCDQFYPNGKPIALPHSTELCNSFYVVEFDTTLNAPIFSAEKFRAQTNHVTRLNDFHPDVRLPAATRAEREDYHATGFDQGHMTPAADATTDAEMHDTFLLSNMTPQLPTLNRQAWRLLEIKVRQMVPDYVLTGNLYAITPATMGDHHVPIPTAYYKIIWKDGVAQAWYAENKDHAPTKPIAVDDLEKLVGFKLQ